MSTQKSPRQENETEGDSDESSPVGRRVPSKHGRRLVTGHGEYVDDITMAGQRHARFVRSDRAHALIDTIDTSEAEAMEGVELVWTATELEPHIQPYGGMIPDEVPLARDRVRFVGDEVAVVVAVNRQTAIEAAERVTVKYEPVMPVLTVDDALTDDAPVLHPRLSDDPDSDVDGNVAFEYDIEVGDIERAVDDAAIVVEDTFETNRTNPTPLEPKGCIADYNPGNKELVIHTANQRPHLLRQNLATGLSDIDPSDIVVKIPDIGGGFGVKQEAFPHEVCASVLSKVLERPVKFVFDRSEELKAGRGRHPETLTARLALSEDGYITAWDVEVRQATGAHASFGPAVISSAGITSAGPYWIPNQHVRGTAVYTNEMPGSAVRGFGDPQFTFAREQLIHEAADELDVDPLDIRIKNAPSLEDMPMRTPTGIKWRGADMPRCLELVRDAIDWDHYRGSAVTEDGKLRGVGMGTVMKRGGNKAVAGTESDTAIVDMDKFGEITVSIGTTSIGQGTETGIVQIVADTLGVNPDRVDPITGDTDVTPEGFGTYGDRGAMISGTAAARAAADLRENLRPMAALCLDIDPDDVTFSRDQVFEDGVPENAISIEELAHEAMYADPGERPDGMENGVPMTGRGRFDSQEAEIPDPTGSLSHGYTFGALALVVDVDTRTGEINVADIAISEDLGKVINPDMVEGQTQGAIVQALGEVLQEDYHYDETGDLITDTLVDYHLPSSKDAPIVTKMEEVETPDPTTSHGQRGVGECPVVPVAAAVGNAVADATGIRFTELPLTPDAVLPALVEHGLREL